MRSSPGFGATCYSTMSATEPHAPDSIAGSRDRRNAADIGRCARLELVFARRGGRTLLAHAYAEPPYRVGRVIDAGPIASLIVVCSGPGVFAGDRLVPHVRVERGAQVRLVSQAALQVHPGGASAPAVLESEYDVDDEALLECVWDPIIPFADARLRQRVRLRVAAQGGLFWSDALMAGRVGCGESWRFALLDHELRAEIGGALQYLERYTLGSSSPRTSQRWSVCDARYFGTTLVHSETASAARAEEVQERLGQIDGLGAGVDPVAPGVLVGRVMAAHGPAFAAGRAVLREAFGRPGARRP